MKTMQTLVATLMLSVAATVTPVHAQTPTASCQYILGFATLANAIPTIVGSCTDNQAFSANGDALQHTTHGLLVWRKADNNTAFTDGHQSWVNGPFGVQIRLDSQRFKWEVFRNGGADLQDDATTRDYLVFLTFDNYLKSLVAAATSADDSALGEYTTPTFAAAAKTHLLSLRQMGPHVTIGFDMSNPLRFCYPGPTTAVIDTVEFEYEEVTTDAGQIVHQKKTGGNTVVTVTCDGATWRVSAVQRVSDGEMTLDLTAASCQGTS